MTLWGGSPVLPSWKNKEFLRLKSREAGLHSSASLEIKSNTMKNT